MAAGPTNPLRITAREWDVVSLLAVGMTHQEAGRALYITTDFAKKCTYNLRKRWGARTTVHLIGMLWQRGYLNHLLAAPPGGFEPPTSDLTGPHSAVELQENGK